MCKWEECPGCGESGKDWAYDGQRCHKCGYPPDRISMLQSDFDAIIAALAATKDELSKYVRGHGDEDASMDALAAAYKELGKVEK